MRYRMGKGETAAFNAALEKKLNEMYAMRGFYPSLREIGENLSPPRSPDYVFRALRRLSAAGKLTPEAELIYNSKKKQENTNDKTGKDAKTTGRAKTAKK